MKLLIFILTLAALAVAQPQPLTNADVVRMCQQGIAQATVIQSIKQAPRVEFRISPDYQPDLLKAGVPQPVLDAMIDRVMKDEARSNYSWPENAKPKDEATVATGRAQPGRYGWGLAPGHPEISGFIGVNAGPNRTSGAQWSGGAQVQVGLIGPMAIWGDYAYNRILSESIGSVSGTAGFHEGFVGLSTAWPTRISPYLAAGVGVVRGTGQASSPLVGSISVATVTRSAETAGVGINFGITHMLGARLDVRAIVPQDPLNWYARVTVGLYGRF